MRQWLRSFIEVITSPSKWWGKFKALTWQVQGFLLVFVLIACYFGFGWLGQHSLSQNKAWANTREVFLFVGSIIVIFNYTRDRKTREKDVANQRFVTTLEAERFFLDKVLPLMRRVKSTYNESLKKLSDDQQEILRYLEENMVERKDMHTVDDLIVDFTFSVIVEDSHFSELLQRLSYLSSYTYYDKVNVKQLYSIIGDDVDIFVHESFFKKAEREVQRTYYLNNYEAVIKESENYIHRKADKYGKRKEKVYR